MGTVENPTTIHRKNLLVLLILAIIVLALLGGFLGDVLEFAFWAVVLMAAAGAVLGYFAVRSIGNRRS